MKSNGAEDSVFFDFMLSKPKNLINDTFQLMTYDHLFCFDNITETLQKVR